MLENFIYDISFISAGFPSSADDFSDIGNRKNIMNAIDTLNSKFGRSKIYFGVNHNSYRIKSKQMFLSPSYTTSIKDLFIVNAD